MQHARIFAAIGAAALAGLGGAAAAADLNTFNNSTGYADPATAAAFMPAFLSECGAAAGGTSTASGTVSAFAAMNGSAPACAGHGFRAMQAAANGTFFSGGEFVVPFSSSPNSGYTTLNNPAFDNGLFDVASGSYFTGLSYAWADVNEAAVQPGMPMGAPTGSTANMRTEWVDQTTIGYVVSTDTAGVLGEELTQAFRSSLSWSGGATDPALAKTVIDQRIAQQLELGMPEFEASRQTFQQAIQTVSDTFGAGATTDPDAAPGHAVGLSQLVAQDVQGYLFSCLNCATADRAPGDGSRIYQGHQNDSYAFVPYWSNWNTVPTITHSPDL